MDFNADGSAAIIQKGSKLNEFLNERINQYDMQNHFISKENYHNLWNMITNDDIYKDERESKKGRNPKEEDC